VAIGSFTGLRSIEGVLRAAAAFAHLIDVQIVAHISRRSPGWQAGRISHSLGTH